MTVQFLDISGSRMAVLPVADYERLIDIVEDRADAATAILAEQRRLEGEEYFPSEFVDRILDGENRLKVWRNYRNLKLREVSAKAKISIAYISDLERNKRHGNPKTWRALASALDADVDDIMPLSEADAA
ncbi:MAG: helix-turn-helix transcriptional regulator [Sphingomonadales bacterium]